MLHEVKEVKFKRLTMAISLRLLARLAYVVWKMLALLYTASACAMRSSRNNVGGVAAKGDVEAGGMEDALAICCVFIAVDG